MTEHFILPERLDSSAAPALMAALGQRTGRPLAIDAGQVEVIGALALEVIVSAGLQWAADGQDLTITRRSARFDAACTACGLRADAPWAGAAQDCEGGVA
ncbi:STAS domain-containing protein [Paracoccus sp. (in: a-proteobacteria)]|uniref:STAS domain-containing protein n=1 Tax=Paracoccus sp. TaxID=267 RepID=UPI00272D02FC|nr:STAS domain-containing protein [Paracoccus sp. (in: a-proteobacteria)]